MRYEVKDIIKFGMIFAIGIYDNKEKQFTAWQYDESERHIAESKCELMNCIYK